MERYSINIYKEGSEWVCCLEVENKTSPFIHKYNTIYAVKSNSYSELQIEIGNQNWIDLINKNE